MGVLTQQRVDEVTGIIASRQTRGFNPDHFSTGRIISRGFSPALADSSMEPPIMLASTSKIAIAKLMAQSLGTAPTAMHYGLQLLMELSDRNPKRFDEFPQYYRTVPGIARAAKIAYLLDRSHKLPFMVNLLKRIGDVALAGQQLPTLEMFYQAIGLSSNEATRIIQEHLMHKVYGSQEALLEQYANLVPSYINTITLKGGRHWMQTMPNTGILSEFATLMQSMIMDCVSGKANAYERALVEIMTKNPEDFHHCYTHSAQGQSMIASGVEPVEKTGYYPAVTWIPDLGMPCHMTISTVCGLKFPDGNVFSFSAFWNIEMPMPDEPRSEWGVTYGDEWGAKYAPYAAKVKAHYSPLFRQWVAQQVSKHN